MYVSVSANLTMLAHAFCSACSERLASLFLLTFLAFLIAVTSGLNSEASFLSRSMGEIESSSAAVDLLLLLLQLPLQPEASGAAPRLFRGTRTEPRCETARVTAARSRVTRTHRTSAERVGSASRDSERSSLRRTLATLQERARVAGGRSVNICELLLIE